MKRTRRQDWLHVGLSQEENLNLKLYFGHPEREGMTLPSPSYKWRQSEEHSRLWWGQAGDWGGPIFRPVHLCKPLPKAPKEHHTATKDTHRFLFSRLLRESSTLQSFLSVPHIWKWQKSTSGSQCTFRNRGNLPLYFSQISCFSNFKGFTLFFLLGKIRFTPSVSKGIWMGVTDTPPKSPTYSLGLKDSRHQVDTLNICTHSQDTHISGINEETPYVQKPVHYGFPTGFPHEVQTPVSRALANFLSPSHSPALARRTQRTPYLLPRELPSQGPEEP